uniref:Uncharacterized protein n=1 Tax=Cacopsylla melanoneura TaxID=428564 RepID=A0A8D8XTF2_9HEMI
MAVFRICLAVSVVAILLGQGESTQLCGLEIEYSGFNPIEALQLIQVRQIQDFEKYRSILSQLKFQLKSEDYSAWRRCLKEFRKEKLRYVKEVNRIKASFAGLVRSLVTRKLDPAQYEIELQKLFQQFQTQFTPAVESFKTKIQYLFDTISDDNKRKEWWSTMKTTEVQTENGQTTRTSLTQMDSGIGGQRTQSITKQSQSVSNAVLGGSSNVLSQSSSFKQSKLGGSSGGYGGSSNNGNEGAGNSFSAQSESQEMGGSQSKYSSSSERSGSSGFGSGQQYNSGDDSPSQQSNSGYDATNEQSSGNENEQSDGNSCNSESESQSFSNKRSGIESSSQQSSDDDSSNNQFRNEYDSSNQQSSGEYNSETQQSSGRYGSSNGEYDSATQQSSGGYGSSRQQSRGGYRSSSQQTVSGSAARQQSSTPKSEHPKTEVAAKTEAPTTNATTNSVDPISTQASGNKWYQGRVGIVNGNDAIMGLAPSNAIHRDAL